MLKFMSLSDLYGHDYTIDEIYAVTQYWREGKVFESAARPRVTGALVYFQGADAIYRYGKNDVLEVKKGDVIYIPQNSRYSSVFLNTRPESIVMLEFKITDKHGIDIVFETEITKLPEGAAGCCRERMKEIASMYAAPVQFHAKIKALIYGILSDMGEIQRKRNLSSEQFEIIKKGIEYLEEDMTQCLSIDEVARMCNVSNSYFRRLFKQYSGVSPVEYRYNRKISRAMENLKKVYLSVEEISQMLGFETSSYFCRIFKKKTGLTPLEFRKNYLENLN